MKQFIVLIAAAMLLYACKTGTGIFGRKTPHEQYADKLSGAGLKETALGRAWFDAASRSLANPITITIPYKETGYFAADRPQAAGLRFQARRGEKITISLTKKPTTGFLIYLELWQAADKPKLIAAADTINSIITHEADEASNYIVRVQPELLKSGEYTLSISAGPSLAYPLINPGKNRVESFWGAARDAGARSHEGIDIFAPRLTPAIAAADGRVTRVNENTLGGKVVFMQPNNKDYVLYYAHLDQQLVTDGQEVKTGDTLGLVGNTGNARTTAPHLHFGIYTSGGAIDPFPFVDPVEKVPGNINAPLSSIGKLMRTGSKQVKLYAGANETVTATLDPNTLLQVDAAATGDYYKVMLPDGTQGLVKSNQADATTELRKLALKREQAVYDMPDSIAPRKIILKAGDVVSILAAFNDYYYVLTADVSGWISK